MYCSGGWSLGEDVICLGLNIIKNRTLVSCRIQTDSQEQIPGRSSGIVTDVAADHQQLALSSKQDGAGGQFIVVLPGQDVVVAITADTGNMQGELDAIWDHLLPAFQPEPLAEDAASQQKLREIIANLAAHPRSGGR
jgi:hypothetical protein